MSTPEPIWNPDGHLEHVYRRGRQLRNRRRLGAVAGGTVAALALVAAVAGLIGASGSNGGQRVATAGSRRPVTGATSPGSGSGAGVAGGAVAQTTATTGPSGLGGAGVPTSTPTSGSTSKPRVTTIPTTATTRPSTAVTTAPRPTTTTVGPIADCASGELAYSTATDKTSYSLGDSVVIDLVVRNTSGHTCNGPSNAGISAFAVVRNSSGVQVFRSTPIGISCTLVCTPPLLAPGGTASYGAGSWDAATPAGTYSAVATRGAVSASPTSFAVK